MVSRNAGLGGANSGVASEVVEEHDEPGRRKTGDRYGPEEGLVGANIIAETSEYEDVEELGREYPGESGVSLAAEVGLAGAKTMLGRSFKDELQEVLEYMLEDNIAGADGRRADIIDASSCETGEEGEKKSMNDCWS